MRKHFITKGYRLIGLASGLITLVIFFFSFFVVLEFTLASHKLYVTSVNSFESNSFKDDISEEILRFLISGYHIQSLPTLIGI